MAAASYFWTTYIDQQDEPVPLLGGGYRPPFPAWDLSDFRGYSRNVGEKWPDEPNILPLSTDNDNENVPHLTTTTKKPDIPTGEPLFFDLVIGGGFDPDGKEVRFTLEGLPFARQTDNFGAAVSGAAINENAGRAAAEAIVAAVHYHGASGAFSGAAHDDIARGEIRAITDPDDRNKIRASALPDIDAGKITSGVLEVGRIPLLNASQIVGGTFPLARLPEYPINKVEGLTAALAAKADASSIRALPDPAGKDGEFLSVAGGVYALVAAPEGGNPTAANLSAILGEAKAEDITAIDPTWTPGIGTNLAAIRMLQLQVRNETIATRDFHAALLEAYIAGAVTHTAPFTALLRGTPNGAGEIALSLDTAGAVYNADIGGRRGITGLGAQADKVIYCELSNPTEHALYIRLSSGGGQAFYGIYTDQNNNRYHAFYDPDENVGLEAGRKFAEDGTGNVSYVPGDRIGYNVEVRPGGASLWVVPVIFRAAGGNPIQCNDIEFNSANAVTHYDADAILIHGGDFVKDLWVARHTGASIPHSQIAHANFAALPGLGIRTEGAGRSRLTLTAALDFTGGLFLNGVDITTLLGGGDGEGLTEELADARYRKLSDKIAQDQITGLVAALAESELPDYVAGDANKILAISGTGGSVGFDTLQEVYTANEFFAAEKAAGLSAFHADFLANVGSAGAFTVELLPGDETLEDGAMPAALPLPDGVVAGDLKGFLNGVDAAFGTLMPLDVETLPEAKPASGGGNWQDTSGVARWRIWKDGDAIKVDRLLDNDDSTAIFTSLTIQIPLSKRLELAAASGGGDPLTGAGIEKTALYTNASEAAQPAGTNIALTGSIKDYDLIIVEAQDTGNKDIAFSSADPAEIVPEANSGNFNEMGVFVDSAGENRLFLRWTANNTARIYFALNFRLVKIIGYKFKGAKGDKGDPGAGVPALAEDGSDKNKIVTANAAGDGFQVKALSASDIGTGTLSNERLGDGTIGKAKLSQEVQDALGGGGGITISDRIDVAENLRSGTTDTYDFNLTNAVVLFARLAGSSGGVRFGAIAAQRGSDGEWVTIANASTSTLEVRDDGITLTSLYENFYALMKTGGQAASPRFTALADTPAAIVANKFVKGNAAGDALEFVDAPAGGGSTRRYLIKAYLRIHAGDIPSATALTSGGVWSDQSQSFTTKPTFGAILGGAIYDDSDFPSGAFDEDYDYWEYARYFTEGEGVIAGSAWRRIKKIDQDPASAAGGYTITTLYNSASPTNGAALTASVRGHKWVNVEMRLGSANGQRLANRFRGALIDEVISDTASAGNSLRVGGAAYVRFSSDTVATAVNNNGSSANSVITNITAEN